MLQVSTTSAINAIPATEWMQLGTTVITGIAVLIGLVWAFAKMKSHNDLQHAMTDGKINMLLEKVHPYASDIEALQNKCERLALDRATDAGKIEALQMESKRLDSQVQAAFNRR